MRALAAALVLSAGAAAADIQSAQYVEPTSRYPHAVLGDAIEHAGLEVTLSNGQKLTAIWREELVFEDTAPRVVDLDGDGSAEVITVESHQRQGARLAVWGLSEDGSLAQLAQTPFIGTRFRWLALVGAADLDGDGVTEIAYVDRPHLAKTLRVWSYLTQSDGSKALVQRADYVGVTNHRIGEVDIAGGIRDCGAGPQMIVASANWRDLLAVSFDGDFKVSQIGDDTSRAAFAEALRC